MASLPVKLAPESPTLKAEQLEVITKIIKPKIILFIVLL
jgi:hypothetical protein